MENPAVASALYWLGWMSLLSKIAAGLVAAGVVLEFGEGWLASGWQKTIDDARTLEVATLQKESADATRKANEAALALAVFKAPRTLSVEQRNHICEMMKLWKGQKVSFAVANTREAVSLLQTIRALLVTAGWEVLPSQMGDLELDGAGQVSASGVHIQVPPGLAKGTLSAGAATRLAEALQEVGINAQPEINPTLKNAEAINVMVGEKPQ